MQTNGTLDILLLLEVCALLVTLFYLVKLTFFGEITPREYPSSFATSECGSYGTRNRSSLETGLLNYLAVGSLISFPKKSINANTARVVISSTLTCQ